MEQQRTLQYLLVGFFTGSVQPARAQSRSPGKRRAVARLTLTSMSLVSLRLAVAGLSTPRGAMSWNGSVKSWTTHE